MRKRYNDDEIRDICSSFRGSRSFVCRFKAEHVDPFHDNYRQL